MRLTPFTSITEGIITMSLVPTKPLTSPAASVESITLGNPTGSPRIAAVATDVPPPPPMLITPWMSPSAYKRRTTSVTPSDMARIASPRSPRSTSASKSAPAASATCRRDTSGAKPGSFNTPKSITRALQPRFSISVFRNAKSCPLVSNAPITAMVLGMSAS